MAPTGFNTGPCITSDADCDGDAGYTGAALASTRGVDNPLLDKGEFAVVVLDFGLCRTRVWADDADPSVAVIGVPASNLPGEFLGTARAARAKGDPRLSFGSQIHGVGVQVFNYDPSSPRSVGPSTEAKHLEFVVTGFSRIPAALAVASSGEVNTGLGATTLSCISMSGFLGSVDDGSIPEDSAVEQSNCPQPVAVATPTTVNVSFEDLGVVGCGGATVASLTTQYRGLDWLGVSVRNVGLCPVDPSLNDGGSVGSGAIMAYHTNEAVPASLSKPLGVRGTFGLLSLRLALRSSTRGAATVTLVGTQANGQRASAVFSVVFGSPVNAVLPPAFGAVERVEVSSGGAPIAWDDVLIDFQGLVIEAPARECSPNNSLIGVRISGVLDMCDSIAFYEASIGSVGKARTWRRIPVTSMSVSGRWVGVIGRGPLRLAESLRAGVGPLLEHLLPVHLFTIVTDSEVKACIKCSC